MVDISKRKEVLITHAKSKLGADVYYRESWECDYFSLQGKCFGRISDNTLTVKGEPENNEILRKKYKDVIIPGYYANKKHWNTITIDSEKLTIDELKQFIDASYDLVYKNLTRKEQIALME